MKSSASPQMPFCTREGFPRQNWPQLQKAVLSCVDGSLFASTDLMIKPVRSSLVFGLLARRTWPLALMVSTNQ
ncbi:hypothetical protein, partial [Roseovarius gaetbuli]|uniref:hypothetical protein n=1 Tax=Roseovarius gaetbuli TaxID=1356575 RepID=UPI001BB00CEC